jgi:hypothetical protein
LPLPCFRFYSTIFLAACLARAASDTGSISGTLTDPSDAKIPGVPVSVRNMSTGVQRTTVTTREGFYAFPSLPIGSYEIEIDQPGFKRYQRNGLRIDANSAVQADAVLEVGARTETIAVTDSTIQVQTADTQVGQTISGRTISSTPLNGRSFTDLLALQPGVIPVSSQQPNAVVMGGVTTSLPPSGDLNAGNLSISGQRETANGFMVNGSDVEEDVNMGTSIIPNLDSIAEFRILTNNFDAEYGNYSGGQILVATKAGSNQFHGGDSNISATLIWMLATSSHHSAPVFSRISLAVLWAAPSAKTNSSSSPITRAHAWCRESTPA